MRYIQKGERNKIGATGHFFKIGDKHIVVDWGIDIEARTPGTPDDGRFLDGERVDILVITHAHLDHIGAIPRFVALHPEIVARLKPPGAHAGAYVFLASSENSGATTGAVIHSDGGAIVRGLIGRA